MGTSATLRRGGVYRWMWFSALGWRLKISVRKLDATYGSYLGGEVHQNRGGYLARDDQPRLTTSAHTAVARQRVLTSLLALARQASSKLRGGA